MNDKHDWTPWRGNARAWEGALYDLRFADGSVRRKCEALMGGNGYIFFVPVNHTDRKAWERDALFDCAHNNDPSAIKLRRYQPKGGAT